MIVNFKLNKYFCISDVVNTTFKTRKLNPHLWRIRDRNCR